MKRRLLAVLSALSLLSFLLCACKGAEGGTSPEHPFLYYYLKQTVSYTEETGVMGTEAREYDPETQSIQTLLSDYFSGAQSEGLTSPFFSGTKATDCKTEGTTVYLTLNSVYSRLSGVDRSLADACLSATLLQVPGIDRVCIKNLNGDADYISAGDVVLRDDSAQVQDTSVTLYFADAENRYLIAETRSTEPLDDALVPEYVVKQLIAGTKQRGLQDTIPKGTELLSVKVADGVCVVDLSVEFLSNKPQTHAAERMTVYSIVDSLTELDSVDTVEFRCDGELIEQYVQMNLSDAINRNQALIGPVQAAASEVDATLCVGGTDPMHLLQLPTRVAVPEGSTEEAATLDALLNFQGYNVYHSCIPQGTRVNSVIRENGICEVDLSGEFLSGCEDYDTQCAAMRSVAGTLLLLQDVRFVTITVEGERPDYRFFVAPIRLAYTDDWFLP